MGQIRCVPVQRPGIAAALRKSGPPQFAVWGLPGSDIVLLDNTMIGWRHALFAETAAVMASHNHVSDYWQVGMKINDPTKPAIAIGNVFTSESNHAGVNITGDEGLVQDNRVEPPQSSAKQLRHRRLLSTAWQELSKRWRWSRLQSALPMR